MPTSTREKLIEAARQLFARKGVENTTINDIADATDKDRRTIYTYFRNKHEIYDAVLERDSEQSVTSLREIAASDMLAADKLRLLVRHQLDATDGGGHTVRKSLRALLSRDGKRLQAVRSLAQAKEQEILDEILRQGVAEGTFDKDTSAQVSMFLLPLLRHMDPGPEFSVSDGGTNDNPANIFIDFIVNNVASLSK